MLNIFSIRRVFLLISIGLFIASLTYPCFDTEKELGQSGEGAALLISGCFGFFTSFTGLIWLANPILLYSWILFNKSNLHSLIASIISLCVGLLFLKCSEMTINEGGNTSIISDYRTGYWLWLASILVMVIGNTYLFTRGTKSNKQMND